VVEGEDGYLVPENEKIFAEKCLQLLLDPALKEQMGQKARLNARRDFSAEKIAEELVEIYSDLL
jgi:glycosyltransferase involved in cell wall biosynthesis